MNLFQYLDAHPWWALVYLWTIVAGVCAWRRVTLVNLGSGKDPS